MSDREPAAVKQSRLWLAALCEPLIRAGAAAATLLGRDANATEMALRGRIVGGDYRWRIGRNVRLVGPPSRFRFGEGVCLYGESYLDANGPDGFIVIGAGTHVDVSSTLYGQGGLTIGQLCALAAGTIIYSQTNADTRRDGTPVAQQPTAYRAVAVGDGCWLGAGARILPGVSLGAGAHVGAGAVVTRDVDPEVIVAGVPAREIGKRR